MESERAEGLPLRTKNRPAREDGLSEVSLDSTKGWEKAHLRELLNNSSISGLPKIVSANSPWTRVFWTVLLLAGTIGFGVNMYFITVKYINMPVLNVHAAEYEDFIWPDIVVCNPMNPVPFTKHPHTLTEMIAIHEKMKKLPNVTYGKDFDHLFYMSSINPKASHFDDIRSTIPFWTYRYGLNQMTPKAHFITSVKTSNDMQGFKTLFYTMTFPTPCFVASPNAVRFFKRRKRLKNLELVKFPFLMIEKDYRQFLCHLADRGLFVYVVPPNHTLSTGHAIKVPPGGIFEGHLYMHRTERLKTKTHCRDEAFEIDFFDATMENVIRLQGTYEDCKNFVSQNIFLEHCKCYNPMFPIHKSKQHPPRLCFNMTLFSPREISQNAVCLGRIFNRYSGSRRYRQILKKKCGKYLRPLCNEITYRTHSHSEMMTTEVNEYRAVFLKAISKHFSTGNLTFNSKTIIRNLATLAFLKGSNTGSYSTQELEYDTSQYISDIGGIVGLWIGLSVVGLFELIEIGHAVLLCVLGSVRAKRESV